MEFKKSEWPDVGDLVIATVIEIADYGAYVRLDEYKKEGLLHISEVASRWVRNIRVFVRERQKVVLKVLRVNTEKGHVDLSLRRVTKREKKEKILLWKKDRKADTLLLNASEKLNISPKEIYEKVLTRIKLKPEETVFIDDTPKFVAGARKVGMHAIRFRSQERLIQDLQKLAIKI